MFKVGYIKAIIVLDAVAICKYRPHFNGGFRETDFEMWAVFKDGFMKTVFEMSSSSLFCPREAYVLVVICEKSSFFTVSSVSLSLVFGVSLSPVNCVCLTLSTQLPSRNAATVAFGNVLLCFIGTRPLRFHLLSFPGSHLFLLLVLTLY